MSDPCASESIHYAGLLEISEHIRRREISSETVTRSLLERIQEHDERLHSVLLLLADSALEQARCADQEIAAGMWRGPLHGVPVGIKDILWTKDLPTTAGTVVLQQFRPINDATVVKRLKDAGAVLIAKLHLSEGATLQHHPAFPRPVNPWSTRHWTGASSSGAGVATAAGFCYATIATDTGGSIRVPSAANNLTGIKPTWGRVSRYGLLGLSESSDHIGPIARSVEDVAAVLQIIAGSDVNDATAIAAPVPDYLSAPANVSNLVIGIDWNYAGAGLPEEIIRVVRDALQVFIDAGARVQEFEFPWSDNYWEDMTPVFGAEAAVAHADNFPIKADQYGPGLRAMLESGNELDGRAVARGYLARDQFKGRLRAAFRGLDVILTPALGMLLPTWEELKQHARDFSAMSRTLLRFTSPFNVAGVPTLSLPAGFTHDGLPLGIQLIAPWLDEATLLRAGKVFQRATSYHTHHPILG